MRVGDATVGSIADSLDGVRSVLHPNRVVTSITHDSRQVGPGTLFVAIVGEHTDGHAFIDAAIAAGATAILAERPMGRTIGEIVVDDTRVAMAWAARTLHGAPDESLSVVGVTGTNGKTTVAHLCEAIWRADGRSVGLIGTLGARIDGEPVQLERTTPEATDLQALLATMRGRDVDTVVMEVSSHAMELHRADAICFEVVAFTNLSQDHLDFHTDMETYFAAKASLFSREHARKAVINIDDAHGRRLADRTAIPKLLVGRDSGADMVISAIDGDVNGTSFTLTGHDSALDIAVPLIGDFNVCNAAIAATVALTLGTPGEAVVRGLAAVPPIRGRMEAVVHDGGFTVLVDYAHTPDAISEVLQAGRTSTSGRVIAVIGAAGDRDKAKRSLMGAAAVRFADLTIITSDNPRTEDPDVIAGEVKRGADAVPGSVARVVVDRRDAIFHAVEQAESGDIVLILGKGHEQGIEVHGEIHPFDDRLVASEALVARGLQLR